MSDKGKVKTRRNTMTVSKKPFRLHIMYINANNQTRTDHHKNIRTEVKARKITRGVKNTLIAVWNDADGNKIDLLKPINKDNNGNKEKKQEVSKGQAGKKTGGKEEKS